MDTMLTHCPSVTVGNTHASTVIAVVRSSVAESATVTRLVVPLNTRALPMRPAVVHVVFVAVPVLPRPEASAVVPPWFSLNP